ncbi:hypothetical protein ACI3ET_10810 [Ornithinimicrobium sp. LYQ121]|uniref:hypothetical protein n=1 Tax=Ornithinimicrobium sp. LYQ121 TaxID=3378801 RepID=UPI003851B603
MHPNLLRLDRLAAHLATDPHVQAVLGLGSAGAETHRFDDHSDIDFFLIIDTPDSKHRYLQDTSWLQGFGGNVAYSLVNDPNGRKALLADGLFLEYAIFTPDQVAALPFTGARVVWSRGCYDPLALGAAVPAATAIDTVGFHLNEPLTNLYVGLHRELRGEHLAAMRFIQVYAVDRVLALVRLDPATTLDHPDHFEATRRIERARLPRGLPLHRMVPGYTGNLDAARAVLAWLTAHHDTDPAIVAAIRELTTTLDTQNKTDSA